MSDERILLGTIVIEHYTDVEGNDLIEAAAVVDEGMPSMSLVHALGMLEVAKRVLSEESFVEEDD